MKSVSLGSYDKVRGSPGVWAGEKISPPVAGNFWEVRGYWDVYQNHFSYQCSAGRVLLLSIVFWLSTVKNCSALVHFTLLLLGMSLRSSREPAAICQQTKEKGTALSCTWFLLWDVFFRTLKGFNENLNSSKIVSQEYIFQVFID